MDEARCGGSAKVAVAGQEACSTDAAPSIDDLRIVGCEACGTEGRIIVESHDYGRRDGNVYRDVVIDDPCGCCEGTGGEIIPVEPIEHDDLEMAYG